MLGSQRRNAHFPRAVMISTLPFTPVVMWEILGNLHNLPFRLCEDEEGPSLITFNLSRTKKNSRLYPSVLQAPLFSLEVVGKYRGSSCCRAGGAHLTSSEQGSQSDYSQTLAAQAWVGSRLIPRLRVGPVSEEAQLKVQYSDLTCVRSVPLLPLKEALWGFTRSRSMPLALSLLGEGGLEFGRSRFCSVTRPPEQDPAQAAEPHELLFWGHIY